MNTILRFLKAVFNFVVGDWILLLGTTLGFVLIGLLAASQASWIASPILVAVLLLTLALSLFRETKGRR